MTLQDMITKWEQRRNEWARFKAHLDGKQIAEQVLTELYECSVATGDSTLTIAEASKISGYSVDHLSKLIRAGTIPNAGRKGAPRIRQKDLPLRPLSIARRENPAYDPAADARRLQVRR